MGARRRLGVRAKRTEAGVSATLQQIYAWAVNEQERADLFGRRNDCDCAGGVVRLVDAVLNDQVILDRLKAAAARRAQAERLAIEEKAKQHEEAPA